MKYCDQCGRQLSENAKFCPGCGTPVTSNAEVPTIRICKKCGAPMEDGADFCASCGERYGEQPGRVDIAAAATVKQEHSVPFGDGCDQGIAEYLGRVVALERSVYAQTQTVSQISSHIGELGIGADLQKPDEPMHYEEPVSWNALKGFVSFGAFVGGIIGLFSGGFLAGILIGGIVGLVLMIVFNWIETSSVNSSRSENYKSQMDYYSAALADDEKRVNKELRERKRLSEILETMETQRTETVSILNQYYEKDVIFPKYRNMVAVCSFYEYFMSGRCSTLTGHEGAYNIYESEVRLERICTKLDEIVNNLEQIKANQYVLYDAIQEGNRIMQQLVEEAVKQSRLAEQTAENTALAAHYAEVAANNAEACAWIGLANYVEQDRR